MPSQADLALQALGPQPQAQPQAQRSQADAALALMNASPAAAPGFGSQALGQVGDAATAFGHHLMNLPHGLAQLVENSVSGAANYLSPTSKITGAITDVVDSVNAALAQREADYQKNIPNSAGAYTGAALGEVAPFLLGAPARAVQAVGDLAASQVPKQIAGRAVPAMIPKAVSGATQGAALSVAQPQTTDAGPNVSAGATIGGAIPVVGGIGRSIARAAAPILSPQSVVSPLVRQLVGDDPQALASLQNPPQMVSGSTPTTAQILQTPRAVATEKALANSSPEFKQQLLTQSNTNNEARLAAIQGVAGTPEDLAAALADRKATTQPLIESLLTNGKPVDAGPILSQLSDLRGSSLGTDPVVKKAIVDLSSSVQDAIQTTGQGGNLVRPDLLDGLRQNVRGFLQQHSSNGAVGTRQEAAFEPVRTSIVDAIDGANPGYRDYLATYAQKSTPIRTMEAAGSILDNVGGNSRSANSSGAPQVTLTRYASALAKALNGPYDIDPQARTALEAVQKDLQRESVSNSIRSPGSDTAYNLQAPGWLAGALYGKDFTGNPKAASALGTVLGATGGWLSGHYIGAATGAATGGMVGNKIAGMGQERVNAILAKALSDPQFAARLAQQTGGQSPALTRIPQLAALLGR